MTRSSSLISSRVAPSPPPSRRPTRRRSGWRSLTFSSARAWRPSSTTSRSSATSASSCASGLARLRPAGEVHRVGRALAGAGDQVPPELVGEERHHRRDHAQPLDERVPERPERGLVERVEAPPRAADVPVREVVDELLEGARRPPASSSGRSRRSPRATSCRVRATSQRVERLASRRPGAQILVRRLEVLDVRVGDEERDRVPEREQPPLDLAGRPVAELQVLRGRVSQNCQRMTSAPIRSNASFASIELPHERCISRPFSSSSFS